MPIEPPARTDDLVKWSLEALARSYAVLEKAPEQWPSFYGCIASDDNEPQAWSRST